MAHGSALGGGREREGEVHVYAERGAEVTIHRERGGEARVGTSLTESHLPKMMVRHVPPM